MVTLVEISNDDENSLKLDYLFVQEVTGIDWKSKYQMSCIFKQLPVIEQKDKSDFEYFVVTKRQKSYIYSIFLWNWQVTCQIFNYYFIK